MRFSLLPAMLLLATASTAIAQSRRPTPPPTAALRTFTTPYYMLYTDLDDDSTREAWIRVTKMFEEYKRRTAGFSGDVHSKFPFYLYKKPEDYYAAGGMEGTDGVFMRFGDQSKLMAIAGEKTNGNTWHVIQHEGFHQFADAVIKGDLPPWVNEGLAEYFGEAVFTGDGFVSALIPPRRMARIQRTIKANGFAPIRTMMMMSHEQWNKAMDGANYDQAWSMVHFLAQGENGKYQQAFVSFINLIGRGRPYLEAWTTVFGADVTGFQKKWETWWLDLPQNPTRNLYRKSAILTLTSYLARAASQGQRFENFDAFIAAARDKKIKMNREDWLPPALLEQTLDVYDNLGTFTIEKVVGKEPRVRGKDPDGTDYLATYTLNGNRVGTVTCDIVAPAATMKAPPAPPSSPSRPAATRPAQTRP